MLERVIHILNYDQFQTCGKVKEYSDTKCTSTKIAWCSLVTLWFQVLKYIEYWLQVKVSLLPPRVPFPFFLIPPNSFPKEITVFIYINNNNYSILQHQWNTRYEPVAPVQMLSTLCMSGVESSEQPCEAGAATGLTVQARPRVWTSRGPELRGRRPGQQGATRRLPRWRSRPQDPGFTLLRF